MMEAVVHQEMVAVWVPAVGFTSEGEEKPMTVVGTEQESIYRVTELR